jgi:hypothetical protein
MEVGLANQGAALKHNLENPVSWKDVGNDKTPAMDKLKAMNPIVTDQGSLPMNIGATAANLVPMLLDARGEEVPKSVTEPIPGAPRTPGEVSGPGLRATAEQLFSKTPGAAKRMGEFMGDRTAAIQNAADKVAPSTATPEEVGAKIQNAGRDVLSKQQQVQGFTKDLADRASQELDKAREDAKTQQAAADEQAQAAKDAAEAKATHAQGSAMQDTAATELENRRAAGVQGAKDIAKGISGQDELPVTEADRQIIDALRSGNQEAKTEEGAAHDALSAAAKAKGVTVDTAPMQDVAKNIVQLEGPAKDLVMSSLPASTYKMLEKAAEGENANSPLDPYAQSMTGKTYSEVKGLAQSPPSGRAAISGAGGTDWKSSLAQIEGEAAKNGIQPMESGVPFDVMKTGRTGVREALQGARTHFKSTGLGGNAVRVLQDLHGSMTDAMKKSLEPHPDLAQQFDKANALTVDRTSRYVDPRFVRNLVYKGDSQKVIGAVMRSGGEQEAAALNKALENHPVARGSAQRAAMDYILKRSTKDATGELPGTVRPDKLDYDLAVRNAENSPALKTLLGDEGYQKFHDDLEQKRLAARDPDEVRFEDYLQKVVKAETPEKAAKLSANEQQFGRLAQGRPELTPTPAPTAPAPDLLTNNPTVKGAERKVAGAKQALDKLKPTVDTKGVQTVTSGIANELQPSTIVDRAGSQPEYTDKLLQVIDRAPNGQELRNQLGQRIYRNAMDKSMVNGAFGAKEAIADTGKMQSEYQAVRPSLERILPKENIAAMDELHQALGKYSLSGGIGSSGGMGSRIMQMRQLFAIPMMIHGILTGNPATAGMGAAVLGGPKLWMQFATHPGFTRAVSASLKAAVPSGAGLAGVAAASTASKEGQDLLRRDSSNRSETNDQAITKQRNPAQPITPPSGDSNATPQNKWVQQAIDRARAKNAPPDLGPNKWVAAAIARAQGGQPALTPPVSLWVGKDRKILTLTNPSTGRSEKWKIRNGAPVRAD